MDSKGFYMVAGNVVTDLAMEDIRQILLNENLSVEISKGELRIKVNHRAKINFRDGFDHEFILVGHAKEESHLLGLLDNIEAVLQSQGIQYSYELYDRDNNIVAEYDFHP